MIQRFTAYRRNISQRDTHNHYQKNPDDMPQFEGVIWTDGTVTLRWLTACTSHSIWASIEDCLNVHGHPEYGTVIVWHDGTAPKFWKDKITEYRKSQGEEIYEIMDYNLPPGSIVYFLDENGYDTERENARMFFTKHQKLTIYHSSIGNWRTDIEFVECPGNWFNSAMFGVKV